MLGNCAGMALNGLLLRAEISQIRDDLIAKLARRQFLHFYEDRGVQKDEIIQALTVIEQIIRNYDSL